MRDERITVFNGPIHIKKVCVGLPDSEYQAPRRTHGR